MEERVTDTDQAETLRFPVLVHKGGDNAPLVPLRLAMEICATTEDIDANLEAMLKRPYESFNALLDSQSGEVSICGSGPSLADTYKTLRGDVYACNAAYGWLLDHGVVAKYCMLWDADPVVAKFVRRNPETIYLVGSRVHPSVYEALKGCRVVIWHAGGDKNIQALLEKYGKNEPMIGGGSAAVSRAMFVCYALGYRKQHLHGADSSYGEGYTHVQESVVPESEIKVMVHDEHGQLKWFKTTAWLAGQCEDFKLIGPVLRAMGTKIIVHGSGLLPHIAKTLQFDVDGQSVAFKMVRSLKQHAKTLMEQV